MLKSLNIFFLFLIGIFRLSNCQVFLPGRCPDVKIVETFDLDRYMGTWYDYSKYPYIFELALKCQQDVYKKVGNDTFSIVNTAAFMILNNLNIVRGVGKVIAPGQLVMSFANPNSDQPNCVILGTDYENWAVVYNCRNGFLFGHTKSLWILTRERQPNETAIADAIQIIKANKLPEIFLFKSIQTGCPDINVST